MKKRIMIWISLLLALSMLVTACSKGAADSSTSEGETVQTDSHGVIGTPLINTLFSRRSGRR